MTRVVHVITGLSAGGAEQQLLLLTRRPDGDDEVVSLTADGVVGRALAADGTPVHVVGMTSNRDLRGFLRLVRLLRRGRYDVAHLHLFRALVHGALAARLAGIARVVYTEHSLNARLVEGRPVTAGVRLLYRLACLLVDEVLAVSAPVADRLRALRVRPPVRVVPNAVDASSLAFDPAARQRYRAELGLDEHTRAVGVVGRLFHAKAVDVALRAAAQLPGVRLVVVGTGPEESALRAIAPDAVFTGEHADVPGLLSALDLLLSASPEETFGLALVEARLAGLPVVYVDGPALDGVADPGALRAPPDEEGLRAVLATALALPPRVPPPAALVDRYAADAVSASVTAAYTPPLRTEVLQT